MSAELGLYCSITVERAPNACGARNVSEVSLASDYSAMVEALCHGKSCCT